MTEQIRQVPYNKDKWARGEWDNEPDRVDFIHAGLSCFLLRNTLGNLCGYVGVPLGHPLYGVDHSNYDNPLIAGINVHGGLTYSDLCNGCICHVPRSGMPDNVWWLGFDAGHYGDVSPFDLAFRAEIGQDIHRNMGIYRNVDYMTEETKQLAEQLANMK